MERSKARNSAGAGYPGYPGRARRFYEPRDFWWLARNIYRLGKLALFAGVAYAAFEFHSSGERMSRASESMKSGLEHIAVCRELVERGCAITERASSVTAEATELARQIASSMRSRRNYERCIIQREDGSSTEAHLLYLADGRTLLISNGVAQRLGYEPEDSIERCISRRSAREMQEKPDIIIDMDGEFVHDLESAIGILQESYNRAHDRLIDAAGAMQQGYEANQ